MCPPFDDNPGGTGELQAIYHVARDQATRAREEPGSRVGDTEWAICHKYGISYNKFRSMNGLPSRESQPNLVIQVGRRYVVGYKRVPTFNWVNAFNRPRPDSGNSVTTISQPTINTDVPPADPVPRPVPDIQPVTPTPPPTPPPPRITEARFRASALKASQPLIDYMKSWERPPLVNGRISGQVFRDTKGSMTIGFGHWIKEEEKRQWAAYDPEQGGRREMSLSEMEQLFKDDVYRLAEVEVKKRFANKLRQQEYDALVDLAFHRGGGALRDSGLESYMNSVSNGRYDENRIEKAFMKYAYWYNRNTGQWDYVAGFEKRRKEELDMFLRGRYTLHR